MRNIVLIAHNLRSCHNVGSLLRTAEGLGVQNVIFTGYTPYPLSDNDSRLPHLALKIDKQIAKTALGAERSAHWQQNDLIEATIASLKADGYVVAAVEQTDDSVSLPSYAMPKKIAFVMGREVEGVEPEVLRLCDVSLEIPMFGQKESFNVVEAATMALYQARLLDT